MVAEELETAQGEQRDEIADVEGVGGRIKAAIERGRALGQALGQRVKIGAVGVEAAPVEFVEDRDLLKVNLTGRESGRARVFLSMRTRKKERPRQFRKTVCGGGGRAST